MPKPKNASRQTTASRILSRPRTAPGTNASGIGHTPNPVHFMPPAPQLRQPPESSPGFFHAPHEMLPQQNDLNDPMGQTIAALQNRGIQASMTPHPNEIGWGDYGNGLWVYAPQGPGQSNPMGDDVRGYIASITNPYLAQSYKDQALQQLQGVAQPQDDSNYGSLQQQFAQTIADKGRQLPDSLSQLTGQQQTAPPPVAPAPISPDPTVATSGDIQSPVSVAQPVQTNAQTLGNRSLPGFSAINRKKKPGFASVASRMLGRI